MPFKAKDIEVSEGGMNKPQINTFFYSDKPPEDDEKRGKKRKHDSEGGGNKKPFTPRCVSSDTTLQSKMNAKLSPHRVWPCHENGLIITIQTIPHILYVSFKLTSLYYG